MKRTLAFCAAMLMIGCQPRVDSRGNITLADNIKTFVVGTTTMSDVIQKCGTPSFHIDNFTWIYVGATAEETSFSDVALKNRCVVKLIFDENKILRSIQEVQQPKKDIMPMDKAVTNLKTGKVSN